MGIPAAVYAAKGIIQSSITAQYAIRPFDKILWPPVNVILFLKIGGFNLVATALRASTKLLYRYVEPG